MTVVTDRPETMDLPTRLQLARETVTPLRDRVSELEAALSAAVERADYETAHDLQAELGPARQEYGIAEAHARALAEMQQEIENTRQAEQQKIDQQRQREESQRRVEQLQATEAEHLDEMHRALAIARAGVEAVRESLQAALNHQNAAGAARRDGHHLMAEIDGVQRSHYVAAPNDVSCLLEGRDPILRAVYFGRV